MKKIEDARVVYERLVEQFPNAGKYWKIYIEQEVIKFIPYNYCDTVDTRTLSSRQTFPGPFFHLSVSDYIDYFCVK